MADRVRTHTRRTASGKTATVRQHGRKSRGRAFGYRGGWQLLRKAVTANRKKKHTAAIVLGTAGVTWCVTRFGFDVVGIGLAVVTAVLLAVVAVCLGGLVGGARR